MRRKHAVDKAIDYEVPTWDRIYRMLLKLAQKICQSGFKPDVIVGVSRGGWLPARVLSDLLENANLDNVKMETCIGIGKAKNNPSLTQCVSADVTEKRVLVVDEIADSGYSLRLVAAHIFEHGATEVKTATLYSKFGNKFKPDFYEKETEFWVVFPWEIKETIREILEEKKTKVQETEKEIAKLAEAGISRQLIARFLKEFSEMKPC